MKKLFYFFSAMLFIVLTYGFLKLNDVDPNADRSPALNAEVYTTESDTIPPPGFYPTKFNYNYASNPLLNGGTVGAMYLFGKYHINRWNANNMHVYDSTGPGGGPGNLLYSTTYIGSGRDMTTDGRYLYVGRSTTQTGVLYKYDTNWTQLNTYTFAGQDIRALAYDKSRQIFWCTGFSGNINGYDSTGILRGTITSALTGKYGAGFDSLNAGDTAFVWVWNQGTGNNQLVKYQVTTGTQNAMYTFNLIGGQGIAGGAEIVTYPGSPPYQVLLLNWQNYAITGYRMKDLITALENENELVQNFRLSQNYPNPFNPATKISFMLTKINHIKLSVFDALGREVRVLINEQIQAGEHTLDFNASELGTGVYFYKISVGDPASPEFSDTKKMLLVK